MMEIIFEKQGCILLVDDELVILCIFCYCFEDEGYSVVIVSSVLQVEVLLQCQVFDLCFFDLCLGEDNGFDVFVQMCVQVLWMCVVIVIVYLVVDIVVDVMQVGVVDYLVKFCSLD